MFGEGAGQLRFLSPEEKVRGGCEQMPGFLGHQSEEGWAPSKLSG